MRIAGLVIVTQDRKKGHWEVSYHNGYLLVASSFREIEALVVEERPLNEPKNWEPRGYAVLEIETGKVYQQGKDQLWYQITEI